MRSWMPSGVAAMLAWAAMGVCLAELVERRAVVMTVMQESVRSWMEDRLSGGTSHVYEGRGQ
ncbi:MAG: hypothetical protein HY858_09350 [Candidatus Solibacter usitatus]|nr:hypothetical protein [Candidatus Solibacter usitatus]